MYNLKIGKKSKNETFVQAEKIMQFIIFESNIISQSYAILYSFILYIYFYMFLYNFICFICYF